MPDMEDPTYVEVVEHLDEESWEWMRKLPLYLVLEDLNVVVVHAGLVPGVPLSEQDPVSMMYMRWGEISGDLSLAI